MSRRPSIHCAIRLKNRGVGKHIRKAQTSYHRPGSQKFGHNQEKYLSLITKSSTSRGIQANTPRNACLYNQTSREGHLVAQSAKRPTLDFGSGHDLLVCELEPGVRLCTDSVVPAWDSLSLPLLLPLTHSCSLSFSLSLNKQINFKKQDKKKDMCQPG